MHYSDAFADVHLPHLITRQSSLAEAVTQTRLLFSPRLDIFFQQAESQFILGTISYQYTKYQHIYMSFPKALSLRSGIYSTDLDQNLYNPLKAVVTARVLPSDQQLMQELISKGHLYERRPSKLYQNATGPVPQQLIDGGWKPIAFFSQKLAETDKYSVSESLTVPHPFRIPRHLVHMHRSGSP